METFSALLALCAGNSPVTGQFHAQRPVTRSFEVFFDLRWVNNREAGDLRRQRAHYGVIVMENMQIALIYWCGLFRSLFISPLVKNCLTFNPLRPSDAYMRQYNIPTLVQIMACRMLGAKPLSEPMLPYCQLGHKEHTCISVKSYLWCESFYPRKCSSAKWRPFYLGLNVLRPLWKVSSIHYYIACRRQGPLLLTWFNFNPSMDK